MKLKGIIISAILAAACSSCGLLDREEENSKEKEISLEEIMGMAIFPGEVREHIGEDVWVCGYIIGGDLSSKSIKFQGPFGVASNIAIAPSPFCTERSECISVSLPSGPVRNALNLVTNEDLLGAKIYIKGEAVPAYFGLIGLKPAKDYRIVGDTPPPAY